MRTSTLGLLFAIALAAPSAARADRYGRGLELYQAVCTSCHSMGWNQAGPDERGKRDLTRVVDKKDAKALRKFLHDPHQENQQSQCAHRELSQEQIDDLMFFIQVRAAPAPAKPKPAPHTVGVGRDRNTSTSPVRKSK